MAASALCTSSLHAPSLHFTSTSGASNVARTYQQAGATLRVESSATRRVLCDSPSRNVVVRGLVRDRRLPLLRCGARRKSSITVRTDEEVVADEDLRAGLNETVTEALKVMLAEDDKMLETFKDKVDFLGEFLVQDGQMEAARFMMILRGMLDHEVYPQNEELQGPYKKAFNTLWCLLEDSGWLLKQPGAEIPVVDDEPGEPELEIRFS